MASFGDKLKNVTLSNLSMSTPSMASANEGIMTLDEGYDGLAYSGDEVFERVNNGIYLWIDEYEDNNYSYVDSLKNVSINDQQVNLTQEENSQVIPFELDRFYDGIDLSEMTFQIYYVNPLKKEGLATPINVVRSADKIRFYWLVDSGATSMEGLLEFEIRAEGNIYYQNDGKTLTKKYLWRTKPCNGINILKSLAGNGAIEPSVGWDTYLQQVSSLVSSASDAALTATEAARKAENALKEVDDKIEDAATEVSGSIYAKVVDEINENFYDADEIDAELLKYALKEEIPTKVSELENDRGYLTEHQSLEGYATEEFVKDEITKIDISDELGNLVIDGNKLTVEEYVKESVKNVDISDELNNYYKKTETLDKQEIETAIKNVKVDLTGYAKEEYVRGQVSPLSEAITEINETLDSIDKSPNVKYRASYGDVELEDGSIAKNMFTLWREETGMPEEVQDRFPIAGGGGLGTSVSMKIAYVDGCPQYPVFTVNDRKIIKYYYEGIDSAGDYVGGTASWKIGNKVVLKESISSGENSVDLTDYIGVGTTKVTLNIEYEGSSASKIWEVKVVDLTIVSSFDNKTTYPANSAVEFSFVPSGAVDKTVHFVLNGEEIGTKLSSAASRGTDYFMLPAQEHGAYLLEAYITAEINGKTIGLEEIIDEESGDVIGYNHTIKVLKDIVWFDSSSTVPVIGCDTQNINITQYNSVNIKYCVFDPSTETPEVTWYVNDEVLSTEVLTEKDRDGYYTYSYKANEHGKFELKVICSDSEPKIITVNVAELDIDVSPVLSGLAFDFDPNPSDYSNSSANRLWSDKNTGVKMTVSDNFDWVNGGYQLDENGDKYFCVKAGTNAVIDYNLFGDAAQTTGKEFKVIFRTKNIRQRNTSFLTCMNDGIGLDMKVEHASVYSSGGTLKSLYCEDAIIEYEFNINKSSDMKIMMTYEDGTPNIPHEYTDTTSFRQVTAQPITIGSEDCDIHIYRMKAYKNSLSDEDIMNNFIADARNAEEMIARYNRNQIYNDDGKIVSTTASGDFNADAVMKAAPELRYIFLEVPHFTVGKDSKIDGCTTYFRYPAGKRPEDNWDCTGMRHRGQGTSSDSYGASGRNIDLVMDRDTSLFTWTDENGETVESSTITLTETSFPTDYLNIKVNVASSENTNNAEMARRFNQFQPFLRYIRKKDSRIKDTMEFVNCVVFIRETDEDLTTHTEFQDRDWHFYSIGNVGDSKKTDDTRVNNPNDPKEFVVELMDVDKPLSSFPTGKNNNETCPVEEWKAGNEVYDILYSQDYVYDTEGKFESFAGTTYEFRYEMDGITEEQRETNINVWRDFYKFLATSTDEEIYANLKKYFVVDSALYYYLFTERYTMVDSRAKNSFWHYGKVYISEDEAVALGAEESSYYIIDNQMAAFNNGYRFDLTFGYDFDKN